MYDHYITGYTPARAATTADFDDDCTVVHFPIGFEPLTVAVYGNNLTNCECVDAAQEYIQGVRPEWASPKAWLKLVDEAFCVKLHADRTRHLIGRLTGHEERLARWFILDVDVELRTAIRQAKSHVRVLARDTGTMADITMRGRASLTAYEDINFQDAGLESDVENAKGPVWLPDGMDVEALTLLMQPCRTECHGIQVWEDAVRVTCYPKDENYRLESEERLPL